MSALPRGHAVVAPLFSPLVVCVALLSGAALAEASMGAASTGGAPTAFDPARAPAIAPAQVATLEALVADTRAVAPLAGLSVGVLSRGAVWRGAWGAADGGPSPRPVTLESTFRVASITKTFTAIVAMQLAREGVIDLDADVRRYVPSYPAKPHAISARHLLAHTSGIGHYKNTKDALTRTAHDTAQSLAIFAHRGLAFEPGARFLYSSFGYNLLGAALEGATGARYAALVQARVFDPLGMKSTRLENGARTAHDVDGFRVVRGRLVPSERIDISSRFASGGARSTVDDLLRYARALLDGALVDPASWRAMTTPTVTSAGQQADYGLGFSVYPVHGRAIVAHAGGQPEVSSLLMLAPEDDTAIVLFTNVEGQGSELHRLATAMLDALIDAPLGAEPRRDLYADDVTDELVFEGLKRAFSYGLVERSARDGAATARAFAAFDALLARPVLAANPDAARVAIEESFHPARGRVSPLVGAEMVRVLEARGADRASLRRAGPLALGAAYLDACAGPGGCLFTLSPELAADVRRLDAAWRATPPALRALRSDEVGAHLDALRALVGRPIHQSYRVSLERAAVRLRAAGDAEGAERALALASELHPRTAVAVPIVTP